LFNQRHRKKILIISIVLAVVVLASFSYYLLCAGGLLGYIGGKLCGGKKAGVRGRFRSIIFPIRHYQLHLHHWFLAIVTLAICLMGNFYVVTPQLFYGSMCGLAFQGIFCYDDWFRLVKRKMRQDAEQIGMREPSRPDVLRRPGYQEAGLLHDNKDGEELLQRDSNIDTQTAS
jgi:hypothetical protein